MTRLAIVCVVLFAGCAADRDNSSGSPDGGNDSGTIEPGVLLEQAYYVLAESFPHQPDSDGCSKLEELRDHGSFLLPYPFDTRVSNRLTVVVGDQTTDTWLGGNVVDLQGALTSYEGKPGWSASVRIIEKNNFWMTLTIADEPETCRSEIVLRLYLL